ncbi:MAG: secondary thiamine-phosphate synthase enzyme YjbQ [Candidatus Lokiarchaeia archaeon]
MFELTVETKKISFSTQGEVQIMDMTDLVQRAISESKSTNGIVTVFVPGATGAVTTIEYEPGLLNDFPRILERISPKNMDYEHELRWHDGNGHSHCRASLLGPSLTVPFTQKKLMLGTWQQIVFVELDVRPRNRNVILQIIGE